MSAKHTPSPWMVRELKSVSPEIHAASEIVARVELNIGDDTRVEYHARCQANAALIAAAPDLLAALIELAGGHSMAGEEMARAAIAKATGGTQ